MTPEEMLKQLMEMLPTMEQEHLRLGEAIQRQRGAIEACRTLAASEVEEKDDDVESEP